MLFVRDNVLEYGTRLSDSVVFQGDALAILKTMPAEHFRCCITSPPYWGLRDYGIDGQIGAEGDPWTYLSRIGEVFREVHRVLRSDGTLWLNVGDCYTSGNRGYRAPDR